MENADKFTGDMTYETFTNDIKTVYGVLRCLEVTGEVSKNVSSRIRKNTRTMERNGRYTR